MSDQNKSSNLVAELRKLHADIVECDEGRESPMMALFRRAADALEGTHETSAPPAELLAQARGTDDPKLTLLGLPQSWNAACEYALKCVPDGLTDEHPRVAERYMDIRNAYIAGAERSDFGVPRVHVIRGSAVKSGTKS